MEYFMRVYPILTQRPQRMQSFTEKLSIALWNSIFYSVNSVLKGCGPISHPDSTPRGYSPVLRKRSSGIQ